MKPGTRGQSKDYRYHSVFLIPALPSTFPMYSLLDQIFRALLKKLVLEGRAFKSLGAVFKILYQHFNTDSSNRVRRKRGTQKKIRHTRVTMV